MKNKTVFDVNIWISYFLKARTEQIVNMIENQNVSFFRCTELMEELVVVLNRPKFRKYFPLGTREFILFFELFTEFYNIVPLFTGCSDPKDNYLFDLAYQTNSKYLVSGDKKVLETPVQQSLSVLSLANFKKEIKANYI